MKSLDVKYLDVLDSASLWCLSCQEAPRLDAPPTAGRSLEATPSERRRDHPRHERARREQHETGHKRPSRQVSLKVLRRGGSTVRR